MIDASIGSIIRQIHISAKLKILQQSQHAEIFTVHHFLRNIKRQPCVYKKYGISVADWLQKQNDNSFISVFSL